MLTNDSLIEKLEALRDFLPEDCTFTEQYMDKAIAIVRQHQAEQSGKESMTRKPALAPVLLIDCVKPAYQAWLKAEGNFVDIAKAVLDAAGVEYVE